MIKHIKSINNFGVFQSFIKDGNLIDFTGKNILYGWNYSGKTTISRIFSFMENKSIPEDNKDIQFEIKLYGQQSHSITHENIESCLIDVKVFNSDFIDNNLRFNTLDKKIQGIKFDVGENASIRTEIESNELVIKEQNAHVMSNQKNLVKLNEFEASKFTNEARRIKNECFDSLIEFTKAHLKSSISTLSKDTIDKNIITTPGELSEIKITALTQNNKDKIIIPKPLLTYGDFIEEVRRIIKFVPSQSTIDEVLSNNSDLYSWAKAGLNLHTQADLKKCSFCGQDIEETRLDYLSAFFSDQAAQLKEQIDRITDVIRKEIDNVNEMSYLSISPNDISESLKNQFNELVQSYKSPHDNYVISLNQLIDKLVQKSVADLFRVVNIDNIDSVGCSEITNWIDLMSNLISQHNDNVDKFTYLRDDARKKYKLHLVASFLKSERYYSIKEKADSEKTENDRSQQIIEQKIKDNSSLHSQLKSITAGKAKLNDFIQIFLNRKDISIDVGNDDYFILKRGNKLANNLSEGEKTAIAFAYFIVLLESIEKDGKLGEYVVFIDDPISSLDANHIAQVSSLINNFFFRKGSAAPDQGKVICKVSQIFISTHNFEFYSFLKDATNIKRNAKKIEYIRGESVSNYDKLSRFMIKRVTDSNSIITELPKFLTQYNSEYVYLFSELYSFQEDGCPEAMCVTIPNTIRRFLEMYTLTKLPGHTGEIDGRIQELLNEDISELKILHQFSHFTSFERMVKHNEMLLRIPDIISDIFIVLQKDQQHYNSLLEAIGKQTT